MAVPATGGEPTTRPAAKVTDIFRSHAESFARGRSLTPAQHRVIGALTRCRTAALGGHLEVCDTCGYERPAYNSCRDRHCPGCQAAASHKWLEQRLVRVLPTHHFHVVFTLPEELRPLAQRNGTLVFGLMLRAAAEVLDTLGRQRLGAQLGVTVVLHTWTRAMLFHPHVHCVVTGGGLALDGSTWCPTSRRFLFPVAVMRKLFRGIVRRGLRAAFDAGEPNLGGACAEFADPGAFARLLRSLHSKKWVVYSKPPFAGPDQVFAYLGRYTHRVAISDHRLISVSEDAVTFTARFGQQVTLHPHEFIRRFLLHVLPAGFHKIRHFGVYAATNVKTRLATAHALLGKPRPEQPEANQDAETPDEPAPERRLACPCCEVGTLRRLAIPRGQGRVFLPPLHLDSS